MPTPLPPSNAIIHIAIDAGKKILDVYHAPDSIEVMEKGDKSPLTSADLVAHKHICAELVKLTPTIPILSEESAGEVSYDMRKDWARYWLVDPLDGTKEFIKRNGEFTVNIALIDQGKPVMGVVYAPVLDLVYFTDEGNAYKQQGDNAPERLAPQANTTNTLKIVASRSHVSPETQAFIDHLVAEGKQVELVSMGSSLKLCLVADGSADIYPRLGPTMEWDTGAAHAIVNAAGRSVKQAETDVDLAYGKENLLNPYFIVS